MSFELTIDHTKCDKCMECIKICTSNSLTLKDDKIFFIEEACQRCEYCMELCPKEAIKISW